MCCWRDTYLSFMQVWKFCHKCSEIRNFISSGGIGCREEAAFFRLRTLNEVRLSNDAVLKSLRDLTVPGASIGCGKGILKEQSSAEFFEVDWLKGWIRLSNDCTSLLKSLEESQIFITRKWRNFEKNLAQYISSLPEPNTMIPKCIVELPHISTLF